MMGFSLVRRQTVDFRAADIAVGDIKVLISDTPTRILQ